MGFYSQTSFTRNGNVAATSSNGGAKTSWDMALINNNNSQKILPKIGEVLLIEKGFED